VFLGLMIGETLWPGLAQEPTEPPQVGQVTPSVMGGEVLAVFGANFTDDAKVWVWTPTGEETGEPASAKDLGHFPPLPEKPPEEAKTIPLLRVTPQVLLAVLQPWGNVLWVETGAGCSRPFAFNRPQVWLASEDRALPGQRVRLFGRNFKPNPWRTYGHVRLIHGETGQVLTGLHGQPFDQGWVNVPDFEMDFLVPPDAPPGRYEVYVHAGFGGHVGWSDPFPLEVVTERDLIGTLRRPDEASRLPAPPVVRVTGAAGDGVTDDTKALQAALDRAAAQGGGIALLPSGTYALSRTLRVPPGVVLRGAGREGTQLTVWPGRPLSGGLPPATMVPSLDWQRGYAGDWTPFVKDMTPLLWLETRAGLQDLSLVGGPGAGPAVFVATKDWRDRSEDVFLVRVNVDNTQREGHFGAWQPYGHGVYVGAATQGFTLAYCDLRAGDPLTMLPTRPEHRGVHLVGNTFRVYPRQNTNNGFLDSVAYSLIEDNEFLGGARALTFQRGFHHNWVFNNVIRDVGGRGNAEEMIMSEYGGSFWYGRAAWADADSLQAAGEPKWKKNQFTECSDLVFAFITAGRGLGQYRRVVENTADRVRVEPPWNVIPDETTYFAILPLTYRNLYLNNGVFDCDGRCDFAYGSLVESVVQGHRSRHSEGFSAWSWINQREDGSVEYCVTAFNQFNWNWIWDDGWIRLIGTKSDEYPGPGSVFGNVLRWNQVYNFRNFAMNQYWALWDNAGFRPDQDAGIRVAGSYNIVEGNQVWKGPVGLAVDGPGESNVLRNNRLDQVDTPVLDQGRDTLVFPPGYQQYEAEEAGG